jgi:hypothetical protein
MSTQVCQEHGADVVVYQVVYQVTSRIASRWSSCPLCTANTNVEDLKQQVEDLEAERAGLKDDITDLKMELRQAQEEQGS